MKKENEEKYIIKRNNYVGLLFFALVLAASLYIIKHETSAFLDLSEKKDVKQIEETTKNLDLNIELIMDLRNYLNPGNINTRDIYQSMYIYNEKTTSNNFDDASLLYTAYVYLNRTNKYESRNITCDEAAQINITNLKECNTYGNDSIENHKVQASIPKDEMQSTVRKIFNRNLDTYPDFYINSQDKCYSLEDSYLCLNGLNYGESNVEVILLNGHEEDENTIVISELYKFTTSGIGYKGFNSKEVGEARYKSTFKKVNGSYYWVSTEYIDN